MSEPDPIRPKFITLCGRAFRDADPQYFPQAQYRGRTIYFCTESCLHAFLADPKPFCEAHRKSSLEKRKAVAGANTAHDRNSSAANDGNNLLMLNDRVEY